VQCVYGEEEEDSLCRAPLFRGTELIETKGGHHFDGDYRALAQRILDGYEKRRAA
jgi:type IV secretory pathway VirJ component